MLLEFNAWVSDQGGWLGLAGIAATAGPWIWRTSVRWWAPIPVGRRKRAWELLTRLGKLEPSARGDAGPGTFVDSVQRLAIREESFDAVRRRFGVFLAACLIVYPLCASLMLALANSSVVSGDPKQFVFFGLVVLAMAPLGTLGAWRDAAWNKRALATIDEILAPATSSGEAISMLLINPEKAISQQCVRAGREDLINGTVKQFIRRKYRGLRRGVRSLWGRAVRRRKVARRLRHLIKQNLILRASRTAWQNRDKDWPRDAAERVRSSENQRHAVDSLSTDPF